MKLKKFFAVVISFVMLLAMFPATVMAAENTAPEVVAQQLNLSDDLTLQFYVKAEAATVVNITVAGETVPYDLSKLQPNSDGQYVISVDLAAAQMTEEITLDFQYNGSSVLQSTYSIQKYATTLLNSNCSIRTRNLVRQMLNYGAQAQKYFGVNTDNLANAGLEITEDAVLPTEYEAMSVSGSISGLCFYGASLVFENQIAVRYYFTGSIENVSFDGYEPVAKDGMYYVEVPNVNPQDYSKSISLTATKGEESLSVSYSPLNYIIRMSSKGSDSLKALLNAMYGYHQAAVAYVNDTEAFFGSKDNCQTTDNVDLSDDTGANVGTVTVSENGIAYGYIDHFKENDFYFEAKFHVNGILETESWPKFGLIVESGNTREHFYVDMTTELTASIVGRMTRTNETDDWQNTKTAFVSDLTFSGEGESITMGVLKQGKRLHLFVNGAYVLSSVCGFDGGAMAGFFSFNTGLKVTDYYVVFDDDSLSEKNALVPDSELSKGEVFGYAVGDGIIYGSSDGIDLSNDQGSEPSVRINGGAPQYTYANDVYSDKVVIETKINVESVLNDDAYPKFGLMVNGATEMVKFFIDMTPSLTASSAGVVYQPTNGADDWGNAVFYDIPGMAFTGSDTVKLKLVRDGRAYFFFINDALAFYDDDGFTEEKGAVGIFSFNTQLNATEYSVSAGVAAENDIQASTALDLTCNWFTDRGDGSYTLTTDSDAVHMVDDLTRAGSVLIEDFYSVGGKLTLTDAADWGQARILITKDHENEYFIALERLPSGNYQVFSMSKVAPNDWDQWELILDENFLGTRNSIDFEVLVIGNQLNLLVDNKLVYVKNRIDMTESIVKFTGYNAGTTTVSGLSVTVFADQAAAEACLAGKTVATENYAISYKNDLQVEGADPGVLCISEGEEAGSYYMYVTTDAVNCTGFLAYKSQDLVNWECVGTALSAGEPNTDSATGKTIAAYMTSNYWAPEVVYDSESKLYYMFYSAVAQIDGESRFYADIAVSTTPAGPFVSYNKYYGNVPVQIDATNDVWAYEPVFDFANMDSSHPLYETSTNGYMKVIDMSPFVDPVSGQKYVYFCHDLAPELGINESSIYCMALNNDYTPDYSSITALTSPNSTLNEGTVNEAPYMLYNENSGKYYLLYSANAFYEEDYCVRVAVGDSPVGPFEKLAKDEGGYLLYAEDLSWTAGTGHCCVVSRDGQDYIVYHAHKEQTEDALIRGIAMDELHWVENSDGLLVPVVSGPSASAMPLTTAGYVNVASNATVIATNIAAGSADSMNDGIISHRACAFQQDATFDGGAATVTLQFSEAQSVCAIAVYNGYENMFSGVQSIRLHLASGGSIVYTGDFLNWSQVTTEEGTLIPGSSVALQILPLNITAIEIVMPASDAQYAISEIAVFSQQ